jgi:hypothetical protein
LRAISISILTRPLIRIWLTLIVRLAWCLHHASVLALEHYVLVATWVLSWEESRMSLSFSILTDHILFWSWAFWFCKMNNILQMRLIIGLYLSIVILLLSNSLLELHLLLLSCHYFVLFVGQNWVLWSTILNVLIPSILLFLCGLSWT